jgi:acyl-CoA synthetase (AMP-forming)/AMP-acid ligase II
VNAFDYFFENTFYSETSFLIGKEETSFKQLFLNSLTLASFLQQKMGQGKKIILLSENNLFFITAYLAILKSGNICIPLDPGIEKRNFENINDIVNPSLIFAVPSTKTRLALKGHLITPDDLNSHLLNKLASINENEFNENNLSEIIFTSGSTGVPKGVMISHKNLISNTRSILAYLKIKPVDRMLVVLPFYYCYGLSLLHTHLRAGASVVLNNSFMFLGTVINNLLNYSCTGFAGVPIHFQILLRKTKTFKDTKFPALRYVTQAGGKLPSIFIDEFIESLPETDFYVMYGQTEATARLSYLPPEMYSKKKGSIGIAIPGVKLKIANKKGEEVNSGVQGEIIASGENIMQGYFKDEKSTQETIKNGWLYTGDLATRDDDGYIYICGRSKEFMKIGGERISPKEIEEVILKLPDVIDCTIENMDDELLGETMKATVIVNVEIVPEEYKKKLLKHCSEYLSSYKIPKIVEISNQLIISSTGKKQKSNGNPFRVE